jgi:hypothetical protein
LSEENFMPHIKFDEKYDSISTLLEIGTYFDTRNFYSEEKAKLEAQIAENKRIDEINAKNREIDKKKRYLFDTLNNFEEFRKIDLEKIEKIYELIGQTYEEPKPNPVSEGDAKIAEILSHFEADNSRITPPKREFTFPE